MGGPFIGFLQHGRVWVRTTVTAIGARPPLAVALGAALLLFVLFTAGVLRPLSPNTDGAPRGFDFFGLPRCGLAVRFGTNPFTAAEDYGQYGPWATPWISHPAMCVAAAPLSYLPPWTAFWSFAAFNLLLHLGIIAAFGLRLSRTDFGGQSWPARLRDLLFFTATGFFIPWSVMYEMGQYHSLAVLALALVLIHPRYAVAAFVLSALSKPILAPAALVLVVCKFRRRSGPRAEIKIGRATGAVP